MNYIIKNEKGKEVLKGFFEVLLIDGKEVKIFELLIIALNQLPEAERTAEELVFRNNIQWDIYKGLKSIENVIINSKDYKRIQESLVLVGLTPEAYGSVISAIEPQ
jgi:hypothetical protein